MKRAGGRILAQSESTCVVYGMPKEAVDAGWVDELLAPDEMAARLVSAVRGPG